MNDEKYSNIEENESDTPLQLAFDKSLDNVMFTPREFLNGLILLSQNQNLLQEIQETINIYIERLPEAFQKYPADASIMTVEEFFKAHPEIFETVPGIEPDANRISLFDTTELTIKMKERTLATLPATALTNLLKQFLNNPTRLESPRRNRISVTEHYLTKDTIITYKGKDAEYTLSIERLKELFAKRVQNGAKIFNFLLQKLNEQNYTENTEFLLSELVEVGIYANPDSAYRGLKNVLDKLMHIHVEGTITTYQGRKKKEIANTKAAIIAARSVTYNKCVAVLPQIIRNSAPYITILPFWGYALPSENAYMLLDYIYYLARQNSDKIKERGYFTISLDTVRQHLGLPTPEDVKTDHNRRYNQLIIKPIEDAITAIEDGQQGDELKITPIYNPDYNSIHEYLNGYIEIRLSGSTFAYMEQRAIQEEKKKATTRRLESKKENNDKNKDAK